MSSDRLIKELKIESSLLVSRLQSIIDTQGTLLSGTRSPNPSDTLPRVRRQLWRTMQDLSVINDELADIYTREASDRERQLTQVREINEHETKIGVRLGQIEASDESVEKLAEVRVRETELEHEKEQLETRLREVEKELGKTRREKDELESVVSSMKSSYLMELEECAARKNKIFKSNIIKHHGTSTESVAALTEVLVHEIDAYKEEINKARREQKALKDGYLVWKSGCDTLKTLETSIKRIISASDSSLKEKNQTDIETVLNKATIHLQELLKLSESNEWSLLIVALSQELEALYQSRSILGSDSHNNMFRSKTYALKVNSNSESTTSINETEKIMADSSQGNDSDHGFFQAKDKLA